MANNEPKKTIPLSTIPSSKLTVILNNFIVNTVNHLNKLSVNVDEKLSEFDKKMNDLEIMTTLFEAKLDSLPDDIKSKYPPLQQIGLDDINPDISKNANNNAQNADVGQDDSQKKNEINNENKEEGPENGEEKKEEEKKEEEKKDEGKEEEQKEELSPEDDLKDFLSKNSNYESLFKMLKLGVPLRGVTQKAKLNGYDMDIFNELVEKTKKLYTVNMQ